MKRELKVDEIERLTVEHQNVTRHIPIKRELKDHRTVLYRASWVLL